MNVSKNHDMQVAGFSFVKNAVIYDYPIIESIKSVLEICDIFIIAIGQSSDGTLELIQSLNEPKIKIIQTIWNESLRQGGQVLAEETNKAFSEISSQYDWAFYLQADEVIHEADLSKIYTSMLEYKDDLAVDGLLFKYLHFYGSYQYVGASSKWYRNEIRVIRNDKSIYSFKDAQGFRKGNNEKLQVVPIDACVYHYGWVREPKSMQQKDKNFHKYWHNDRWVEQHTQKSESFEYNLNQPYLQPFDGSHPNIMQNRVQKKDWEFTYDFSKNKLPLKDRLKKHLFTLFGIDLNYKNYKILNR